MRGKAVKKKYAWWNSTDAPAKATVPSGQGVLAILDGQQRLTALNIAVYGSLRTG